MSVGSAIRLNMAKALLARTQPLLESLVYLAGSTTAGVEANALMLDVAAFLKPAKKSKRKRVKS